MKLVHSLVSLLSFQTMFFPQASAHTTNSESQKGTVYSEQSVKLYSQSNHGPDGKLFLDPFFMRTIEHLDGEKILDAGCGSAPWSIYAANNGGQVYAIDLQESMIQSAKKSIRAAGLIQKIKLSQGDVAKLPYNNHFFDKAISICVGCNLPPNSFEKHFTELFRTLKNDGTLVIAAPTSLDIVFTNGTRTTTEVQSHIYHILNALPENPSPELISDSLNQLTEVFSATFVMRDSRLILVENESELIEGENIWRKLPKLVIPNRYYSRKTYEQKLVDNGFTITNIYLPHFNDEAERLNYNITSGENDQQLGEEYISNPPFVILHAVKNTLQQKDEDFDSRTVSFFKSLFKTFNLYIRNRFLIQES